VNHHAIPVNAPKVPAHAYHRDGQMRVDGNYGAAAGYEPNSMGEWAEQKEYREPPLEIRGAMDSYEPKVDQTDNCFYQAGDLYRLMTEPQKAILIDNTARNIAGVTVNVQNRHAAHCYLADKDYGSRIAKALGLKLDEVIRLSEMSHEDRMKATSKA
jgi:catalase